MKGRRLKELIIIAELATLGMVLKPVFSPLFNLLTDFVRIPGGSVTAGVSMLFIVLASAVTGRRGAALLAGILQGSLSFVTGVSAAAGVLVLITYSLPGAAIDLVMNFPGTGEKALRPKMIIAGSAGVLTGAAATNLLYFRLTLIPFTLFYIFGILSGALGGFIAHAVYTRLPEKYRDTGGTDI